MVVESPTSGARPLRRFSLAEYFKLGELGFFEGERVELLDGAIVQTSPKGVRHDYAIQALNRLLVLALADRAGIRVQSAFALDEEFAPEPDIAVIPLSTPTDRHPSESHLLIEVADSSLEYDRGLKAERYAAAGVPEYWIVNLIESTVEVYRDPDGSRYQPRVEQSAGDHVSLLRFPDVTLAVGHILPRGDQAGAGRTLRSMTNGAPSLP